MRRTSLKSVLALCASLSAFATAPSGAQQAPPPAVLTTHPLGGGAYWVSGGRSNSGFVVGDKGVVVIDVQFTPADGQKEIAAIAKVTPKPVDTVVLTHGDPDHVGGLPAFPAELTIIAHENVRSTLLAAAADPGAPPSYKPLFHLIATKYLPTHTLYKSESATLDGVPMELVYVAPAHTNGDIFVYLPKQKIVFAGDILVQEHDRYPVIHIGGSSAGWLASARAMLALNADVFLAGHGGIMTRAQVEQQIRDVEQRRGEIAAMVRAGKTLAEVEQALPEPGANAMFSDFNKVVYDELLNGYPRSVPPWFNIVHH